MKSEDPTRTDPTGAPSPLLRHTEAVSASASKSDGLTPRATEAFHSRAPANQVPGENTVVGESCVLMCDVHTILSRAHIPDWI